MKLKHYLLFVFAIITSFCLRDFHYGNELTYINIVDESIKNKSFFTFYKHGEIYADKPPLYFWIIILGKLLLGYHSILFIGLFSLIPALVIIFVMNKLSEGINKKNNCFVAPIMLTTTFFFIAGSVALRMDMLMSMFIILSLYTFHSMNSGKYYLYNRILFPIWIFLAIFSKGIAGFFIPFFSITLFLIFEKNLRSFFKFWGWCTWLILAILIFGWLLMVRAEGGPNYLYNLLYHQNVDRIINSFAHNRPVYFYFQNLWYLIGPWSLLVIGVIIIRLREKKKFNRIEKFYLCVILTSITLLSLASGKLNIYLLPIIPFIIYLAAAWLEEFESSKCLRYLFFVSIIFIVLGQAILLFWAYKQNMLPNPKEIMYGSILLLTFGSVVILFYFYKNQKLLQAINHFSLLFLILINIMILELPSFQNKFTFNELGKEMLLFASVQNTQSFYFYKISNGKNLKFYLKEEIYELKESDLNNIDHLHGVLLCKNKDILNNQSLRAILINKNYIIKDDYLIIYL